MANIYKGTLGLIGNTPLVEVANIEKELGLEAKVLVKLEYFNPAGSCLLYTSPSPRDTERSRMPSSA